MNGLVAITTLAFSMALGMLELGMERLYLSTFALESPRDRNPLSHSCMRVFAPCVSVPLELYVSVPSSTSPLNGVLDVRLWDGSI